MRKIILKKIGVLFLSMVLVICLLPAMSASADFTEITEGDGSQATPYLIRSEAQFKELAAASKSNKFEGVYFKLMNNISYTEEGTSDVVGVGKTGVANYFAGTFDGNGNAINIAITGSGNDIGLFVGLTGTVKNLGVTGSISGAGSISPLVVSNCEGTISNCYNTAAVTATGGTVAGIAARINGGLVEKCYNAGDITGAGDPIAGIVGVVININANTNISTIENSYNTGNILGGTGTNRIAGIVGRNNSGYSVTVRNCYNSGNIKVGITGSAGVIGGIMGNIDTNSAVGRIENSYNMAHLARAGTQPIGTSCGGIHANGTVTNGGTTNRTWSGAQLYTGNTTWPPPVDGLETPLSNATSPKSGTATADTWFLTQSNYEDAGWNFTTVWEWQTTGIGTGYPKLRNVGGDQTKCPFIFDPNRDRGEMFDVILTQTANGTLSAPAQAEAGLGVEFVMTPAVGFMLDTLTVNGIAIDKSLILGDEYTEAKYVYAPVTGTVTATATFKVSAYPWQGDGTSSSPFLIEDQTGFDKFINFTQTSSFADMYFELTATNIKHTFVANGGVTIGTELSPFKGKFNGGNHEIAITSTGNGGNSVGLFKFLGTGGEIRNLGVTGTIIFGNNGGRYVGGIVANNNGGTIKNCYSAVKIGEASGKSPQNEVGGIVGVMKGGLVENCYNTGFVSGSQAGVGGIVGKIDSAGIETSVIRNCYNIGNITNWGLGRTGGIVGFIDNSSYSVTVENCFNTGNITNLSIGTDWRIPLACGIVGDVQKSGTIIRNCYNKGSIATGNTNNLGVVGPRAIYATHGSTASVTAENNRSWALMKMNDDTISSSDFTNMQNGTSITADDLATQSTYSAWNFPPWQWIGSADIGYPVLANMPGTQVNNFPIYEVNLTAPVSYNAGEATVTMKVQNYSEAPLATATVITAVYDTTGKMVGMDYTTVTNVAGAGGVTDVITLTPTTGATAGTRTVKVMLWGILDEMIPLTAPGESQITVK